MSAGARYIRRQLGVTLLALSAQTGVAFAGGDDGHPRGAGMEPGHLQSVSRTNICGGEVHTIEERYDDGGFVEVTYLRTPFGSVDPEGLEKVTATLATLDRIGSRQMTCEERGFTYWYYPTSRDNAQAGQLARSSFVIGSDGEVEVK